LIRPPSEVHVGGYVTTSQSLKASPRAQRGRRSSHSQASEPMEANDCAILLWRVSRCVRWDWGGLAVDMLHYKLKY